MYRLITFLCIAVSMAVSVPSVAQVYITTEILEKTLRQLDEELDNRDYYLHRRQAVIDSLDFMTRDDSGVSELSDIMKLADRYSGYLSDSALVTYYRGEIKSIEDADSAYALQFRLKRLTTMPAVGFSSEAVKEFEGINIDSLPDEFRIEAFEAGRQMYSYVAASMTHFPELYDKWMDKSLEMQAKLIAELPDSTIKYLSNKGEYFYLTEKYDESKALMLELLEQIDPSSNLAARASNVLSRIAEKKGNEVEHLYYLAISAIADTRSATREVVSLQELGIALHKYGDISRSYKYLSVALANAAECNALMRLAQISEALPVISEANRHTLERERQRMMFAFVLTLVSVAVLIGVLLKYRQEMKKMRRLQSTLETANRTKELYMSQFMNLCTVYMNQLKELCSIAARKISTGHVDELYNLTKSGRFVDEQSQNFYDTFDRAFLHIYPNFVEDVNRLLIPEERIVLKSGEYLNTDLRILAFMRLGVSESAKIAEVLNYSINTIYTYRNKLKNKAIYRDSFEDDVMKINYRDSR